MTATKLRVVLWDLDGTLLDSERQHARLDARVLGELGVPGEPHDLERHIGATTAEVYATELGAAGRPELLEQAMARRLALAREELIDRVVPFRGAEAALMDLPAREVPFALVTSTEAAIAHPLLERFHWAWRFSVVVTGDDVTRAKPDPEPYRLACDRLGVTPAEALAVEDSVRGVASARSAGCRVAAVTHTTPAAKLQRAHFLLSTLESVGSVVRALR